MTLTVYTALFGNRDVLHPPEFRHPDVRYVCYTDNAANKVKGIDTVIVQPQMTCRSRSAKWHKTHPPKGDSLWIDAVYQLIGDPRPVLDSLVGNVAMRPHPKKQCAYLEAIQCAARKSDHPHIIVRQALRYIQAEFPQAFGMWEGGCIFRRGECPRAWQNAWWKEILTNSCRDQISLPYVAWLRDVKITPMPWLVGAGVLRQHKHANKFKRVKRSWLFPKWSLPDDDAMGLPESTG